MLTRKSAVCVRTVAAGWLCPIGGCGHTLNGGLCAESGHSTEGADHEVLEDLVLGLATSAAVLLEVGDGGGVAVVAGATEGRGVALGGGGAGTRIADLEGGDRRADGRGAGALASQRGCRRD